MLYYKTLHKLITKKYKTIIDTLKRKKKLLNLCFNEYSLEVLKNINILLLLLLLIITMLKYLIVIKCDVKCILNNTKPCSNSLKMNFKHLVRIIKTNFVLNKWLKKKKKKKVFKLTNRYSIIFCTTSLKQLNSYINNCYQQSKYFNPLVSILTSGFLLRSTFLNHISIYLIIYTYLSIGIHYTTCQVC